MVSHLILTGISRGFCLNISKKALYYFIYFSSGPGYTARVSEVLREMREREFVIISKNKFQHL